MSITGLRQQVDINYLFTSGNEFNHLLESSGSVLIQGNLHHIGSSVVDEFGALVIGRELQQLLTQVIAKWI
jgi:hypothetical protein